LAVPQIAVILLLLHWGHPFAAIAVIAALGVQFLLMMRLLTTPAALAPWYNATGTSLYVLGMMACAIAIGNAG
jgi:chlorophyll synthase